MIVSYGAIYGSRDEPFWAVKRLEEMTDAEWEQLCDGCGKCCLEKLEDWDTGEISYTNVACALLDTETCRCRRYAERHRYVPNCQRLTADTVLRFSWLPRSCAYRLLAEGKTLPSWHPLRSGDAATVHGAGMSVRGRAIPAHRAGMLEHHIVTWAG